jgi:hypothetical protein
LLYFFGQTQESGTILLHATLFHQPNTSERCLVRTSNLTPYNTCRIEFVCNHCRYDIYFGLFCIKVANLSALNLTFISAGKWKTRRVPNCDPTQQ